jgi:hypothetical protein
MLMMWINAAGSPRVNAHRDRRTTLNTLVSPNRPRRRPRLFPGGTSETPAACFLAFSSILALHGLDHQSTTKDEDEERTILTEV